MFERYKCVLGELLGPERKVVLLTTGYSETSDVTLPQPELHMADSEAKLWRSIPMHDVDGFTNPNYSHVFASVCEWRPGLFDPIVRLVADDVVRNVMVVDPDCRWLLHPYDGGMDVILDAPAARNVLRSSHPNWLSSRPDGL